MKFCDITIAYNESSGGIRTYIDEKRRYLHDRTAHEHLLIIPGEEDRVERRDRCTTIYIESPLLPGQDNYRCFVWPNSIKRILLVHQPDIVELGSYYVEPWAAFAYRRECEKVDRSCLIGCYFHTDVAGAYIGTPLRAVAHEWFDDWSSLLAEIAEDFADAAEARAEKYIGRVFSLCDLAFAASPAQAARLQAYGVDNPHLVPLGVDLELFHPARRSEAIRSEFGAGADSLVLIYAGRLSSEKHVLQLVEALQRLPVHLNAILWIIGHGPLEDTLLELSGHIEALRLLPYETDRGRFASILASADIYVTAGPHETFGLSVIEAQACGLPVVGVDAGALRERVVQATGYLGPVEDAGAMADNIARAAEKRAELGAGSRRHVEHHFSWSRTFERLLDCYAAGWEKLSAARHVGEPLGQGRGLRDAQAGWSGADEKLAGS